MTDEEKAKELTAKQFDLDTDKVRYFCNLYKNDYHEVHTFYNGVLKGLAEGRKEKWHDLRKNPNDLPTKNNEYYCYMYSQGYEIHRFNISQNCFLGVFSSVIAWCELPQFKE